MDDSYFSDAAFVGDSRTEGFQLYSGLQEGTYFCATGATVQSVMEKATENGVSGKETIVNALSGGTYGKIYVMLGLNELGWPRAEVFARQYGSVIQRIQADHPESTIVVQSLPPVSARQDQKHSYVNNTRIRQFNQILESTAAENSCVFLDTASAVANENGVLPPELTFDGIHLNRAGCQMWLSYLKEHPV